MTDPVPDHASDRVEILPVADLPEFRPGDDLTAAIATAAPWLRTGDVLVVTSKIVSKTEGRLVSVPGDPGAREAARRNAVRSEAVRVVARYRDYCAKHPPVLLPGKRPDGGPGAGTRRLSAADQLVIFLLKNRWSMTQAPLAEATGLSKNRIGATLRDELAPVWWSP